MFAFHTEDYDLSSINFHHYGKPKFWYCVSSKDVKKVESYVKSKYPEAFVECPQYMRHKTVLINPYLLKEWNQNISITKFIYKANSERRRIYNHFLFGVSRGL